MLYGVLYLVEHRRIDTVKTPLAGVQFYRVGFGAIRTFFPLQVLKHLDLDV